MSLYSKDCDNESTILKINAPINPSTLKPRTIFEHKIMIAAFITNKNKPNVIKVIGKVNNTKIGFTNKFKSPNTKATINEVLRLST